MTVPVFSFDEFLDYLLNNGCKILSKEYFDKNNIVILQIGNLAPIYLQYKPKYFYRAVVRICSLHDIPIPSDHKRSYSQDMGEKDCPCRSGVAFNNCHGK